ncbi:MAG: 50S ribosomal protein L29 [bacterium]|nr:50S ribosomal protein L29 [bacterium]
MNLQELRDMSKPELEAKLAELSEKKFKLSFKHKITMLENPMDLRNLRRDIARVKTIMREKQ